MAELHIHADCGKTTCARAPGEFCQWLRTRNMGFVYTCGLFDGKDIEDQGKGWLQRLPECMAAEKKEAP